jgi:hypothetical protein
MADLRRFMAKIINDLHADRITETRGRTLAYMASVLKAIVETGDLETRLEALEQKFQEKEKNQ